MCVCVCCCLFVNLLFYLNLYRSAVFSETNAKYASQFLQAYPKGNKYFFVYLFVDGCGCFCFVIVFVVVVVFCFALFFLELIHSRKALNKFN